MTQEEMLQEMQIIVQSCIQNVLNGQDYNDSMIKEWTNNIISNVLKELEKTKVPKYKFIAHCLVLSSRSQYVNDVQMAIWDSNEDVKITTKWANETMQCIVSLWAFRTRYD